VLEIAYLCIACEKPFDPTSHRWLCPHCKWKNSCCEGAPC
jgi:DNA-directed RNA polymerase subunit RPC12/RpoP